MGKYTNGSAVSWSQLWKVIVTLVTLEVGLLTLHAATTHTGAWTEKEQRQFEQRFRAVQAEVHENRLILEKILEKLK